jgi:ABC-type molybdate transport system substrate-binding protein
MRSRSTATPADTAMEITSRSAIIGIGYPSAYPCGARASAAIVEVKASAI